MLDGHSTLLADPIEPDGDVEYYLRAPIWRWTTAALATYCSLLGFAKGAPTVSVPLGRLARHLQGSVDLLADTLEELRAAGLLRWDRLSDLAEGGEPDLFVRGVRRYVIEPYPTKPNRGFVYLLHAETGQYKIGRARDLPSRVNTLLSIQIPQEVAFVCAVECLEYVQLEAAFHKIYDAVRVKGEWFNLTGDDVVYIKKWATRFELPVKPGAASLPPLAGRGPAREPTPGDGRQSPAPSPAA